MGSWPEDVGILALEFVVPPRYVDQSELEQYDGVSTGKYTIGLGQSKMGFCTDCEDINSLCLTAVSRLVERNGLNYEDIGRLEVGTETIIDKSKSVKTVLMQLFKESKNFDVEGIDTTNACYGGTSALFNAISWMESSSWDGRYAIVVAGDIAIYSEGSARPTGGAGAVAMLLGPNAPLVFERGLRATYMQHAYDFYKPNLMSEYPVVDGKLSIKCYLSALDNCYQLYCKKSMKINNNTDDIGLNSFNGMLFHSPYCKLVQKSLARLVLNDFTRTPKDKISLLYTGLERFSGCKLEETYFDRDIEKGFMDFSKNIFNEKTSRSLYIAREVGNMYTPSLYGGLISYLIETPFDILSGQRVGLFSYGSGLASSMFSLKIKENGLKKLINNLSHIKKTLNERTKVSPDDFCKIMKIREENHFKAPYKPQGSNHGLQPGTWYLYEIDEQHRRLYKKVIDT
ncbi:hydroxymethylglutaryl-CoA synthase isoform X2 [Lycorma delicatula]